MGEGLIENAAERGAHSQRVRLVRDFGHVADAGRSAHEGLSDDKGEVVAKKQFSCDASSGSK